MGLIFYSQRFYVYPALLYIQIPIQGNYTDPADPDL